LAKLAEYFNKTDSNPSPFVATICDPRYKLAIFEHLWKGTQDSNIYINRAKPHFKDTYRQYKDRDTRLRDFETFANLESTTELPQEEEEEDDDLFEGYLGVPEVATAEVDNWLKSNTINHKTGDISAFWSSKGYDFRLTTQMAADHLGVPATSAVSESVFLNGGDIITKKRNRLGAQNTRYLLCLQNWGILAESEINSDDEEEL
jgi:hypothetical protein